MCIDQWMGYRAMGLYFLLQVLSIPILCPVRREGEFNGSGHLS